jgi:Uma2 family endonuclease
VGSRRRRLPLGASAGQRRRYVPLYPSEPPDVAIEIISPCQPANAVARRCIQYVADGVAIALVVDQRDRSVVVYRPNTIPEAVKGDQPIDLSGVLPGFRLTAAELFDSLRVQR